MFEEEYALHTHFEEVVLAVLYKCSVQGVCNIVVLGRAR